jgi:hypothetical protein
MGHGGGGCGFVEGLISFSVRGSNELSSEDFQLASAFQDDPIWVYPSLRQMGFPPPLKLLKGKCGRSSFPWLENKKSPPDLAVKRGLNGGWEFATLSFPMLAIRRPAFAGLPAFRRYGPRKRRLRLCRRADQLLGLREQWVID